MNYTLNSPDQAEQKTSLGAAFRKLLPLMADEKRNLISALFAILVNSGLTLLGPLIIAHVIDTSIAAHNFHGVLRWGALLLGIYLIAFVASYLQTKMMGGVGQRVLFNLRNAVFNKLQELPVAFFNQNKAGDLISRINNDTDKLNQFFSQSLMQMVGSLFTMAGAAIFVLFINVKLGAVMLAPAAALLVFTQLISPWVKRKNARNLKAVGGMSAEIQESLNNFKVIVAFNRRDYFRKRFQEANQNNFRSAIGSGLANNIFTPVYSFSANIAQLAVLAYGIYLISAHHFTVGLLISFLAYATNFYNPLRQIAALWANLQIALAGWDRISMILSLHSNVLQIPDDGLPPAADAGLLSFKDVSFGYPEGKQVLEHVTICLQPGKTYALVGPTGGGKTTTASLMARLYDPTTGQILLDGKDIRSYTAAERAKKIGFILQEPYLFTGTVRENITYGNEDYFGEKKALLDSAIEQAGLGKLIDRFDEGLDTKIVASGDAISLGQKQLIAFIRAVLRKPELLILDEATANIDTVTEQLLEEILGKLPKSTTRVIIAHRLNTIADADEIFFVNGGTITLAGSMEHAVDLLLHGKRQS